MKTSTDSRSRVRLYALIAAVLALLILAGVGTYGLLTGRTQSSVSQPPAVDSSSAGTSPSAIPSVPASSSPSAPKPPTVEGSRNPDVFTRNVAITLFTWDTSIGLWPLDYTAAILTVGDPSGIEQAGLASDVAAYMPSRKQWVELRKHATRQSLTIERTYVPDAWAQAVEQDSTGQLPAGATAITIEGTRHRAGTWEGRLVDEDFTVSFTVFLACPSDTDSCHVLRLSQLDSPLK